MLTAWLYLSISVSISSIRFVASGPAATPDTLTGEVIYFELLGLFSGLIFPFCGSVGEPGHVEFILFSGLLRLVDGFDESIDKFRTWLDNWDKIDCDLRWLLEYGGCKEMDVFFECDGVEGSLLLLPVFVLVLVLVLLNGLPFPASCWVLSSKESVFERERIFETEFSPLIGETVLEGFDKSTILIHGKCCSIGN